MGRQGDLRVVMLCDGLSARSFRIKARERFERCDN
jgi:hypothetical protein